LGGRSQSGTRIAGEKGILYVDSRGDAASAGAPATRIEPRSRTRPPSAAAPNCATVSCCATRLAPAALARVMRRLCCPAAAEPESMPISAADWLPPPNSVQPGGISLGTAASSKSRFCCAAPGASTALATHA
jgi:hypothetical protein